MSITSSNNLQYATGLFETNHGKAPCLDVNYLPERKQGNRSPIDELASLQLIYLAMLNGQSQKLPFTKRQLEVFKKSDRANCLTLCGLRTGLAVSAILTVFIGCLGLIPNNQTDDKSPSWTQIAIIITTVVVNLFLMSFSYWATGFAPNTSSNRFNDKQDTLIELKETYKTLAFQLVDLYYNEDESYRSFAKAVASEIKVEVVKMKLKKAIHSEEKASRLVKLLEEVILFITNDRRERLSGVERNSEGEEEEVHYYTEAHVLPEDPLLRIVIEAKMRGLGSRNQT